jgi:hypothetical protein
VEADKTVDMIAFVSDHGFPAPEGGLVARYLTTRQLADALGLSDSTVRHYRSEGRIVPTRQTPGGHARYDLDEVETALGIEAIRDDAPIIGLVSETFEPLGVHDLRPVPAGGSLAAEVVALGVRDAPEARGHSTPRWGGRLLNARVPAA